MIPVVELLRVSTELQAAEERAGLAAQHWANVRTCAEHGLEITETVEIVESGAEVARSPGMARVLDLVSGRSARGVVLAEYSRLFRPDRWSDLVVLQTLADHGAPIYLPSGPIDLQSELGYVQATINNLLAAMERRRIRERMDRGKEEHRRRGAHVAGGIGIPFGTRYTREKGWEWTEDAPLVRDLFRRFLAGERNYAELARSLELPRTNVRFLLQSPIYTGWRVYEDRRDPTAAGRTEAGWRRRIPRRPEDVIRVKVLEPLVSEEDFALVQELIRTKSARVVRRSLDEIFLFRGFLECAEDGLPIYTHCATPGKFFYQCKSRHPVRRPDGAVRCATGYMVHHKLERLLDQSIAARLTDPDLLTRAINAYVASLEAEWRERRVDEGELRERLVQLDRRRERILESYYDGIVARAERDRRLTPVLDQIAATQRMLGQAPEPGPEQLSEPLIVALASTFAEWEFLKRAERRRLLETLSPTFYVGRYRIAGVRFPVSPLLPGGDKSSHLPAAGEAPPARCGGTPEARP